MLYFFDSHAHLSSARLGNAELRRIRLRNALRANVRGVLVPAVDPASWDAIELHIPEWGRVFPSMTFAYGLGLHPYVIPEIPSQNDDLLLSELEDRVRARPEGLRAVGECGLDFGFDREHHARQARIFARHAQIAKAHDLPLVVHCVRAHGALLELLEQAGHPPAVIHAFTGSAELAARYCRHGHVLGFGGALTLPNVRRAREAVRAVPEAALLIETDAPDQTPFARRPAVNEPAFVVDVAQAVADARGETLEWVARVTDANARRVFGLPPVRASSDLP